MSAPGTPNAAFRVEGELTIYRAAELREALAAALADPAGVALDLSAVTEIDGAGVQLLLSAARTAADAGATLALAGCSEAVAAALDILGLAGRFSHTATTGAGA